MKDLIDRVGLRPRSCVWELTRACDLACAHCGTGAGAARAGELSTAEALDLVDQLADLGTRRITLSGGEPTLRPDWPEIARAGVRRGLLVNMVTNGQGDGRRLAAAALEAGLANVAVSLDGLEETHDEIRCPDAFERATATIRDLVAAGVWVHVMLTVNRLNLAEVPAVYDLAGRLGARGFRVQLGKPMGNQTSRRDLTLRPRDLLRLLPVLGRLAVSPGPVVDVGDSIGYFSPHERALRGHRCGQGHWTGCYAGIQAIGVQADGTVKGCLSLQPRAGEVDRFVEGSVRDESLEAIWRRPGGFAYNREKRLEDLTGACAGCGYAAICRGGATCVAAAFTGETTSDPMCWHAARLAEAGVRRASVARAAATAAAAMALAVTGAGCSSAHRLPDPSDAGADGGADAASDAETDAVADADAPPPDCTGVECDCFVCDDYGDPGPAACDPCAPLERFRDCCCLASCDPCEWYCCECDYGLLEPPLAYYFCCTDQGSGSGG